MECVRWKCASRRSDKALPVFFKLFFNHQDGLCFCHNVINIFGATGIACNPTKWCLIINITSSSRCFITGTFIYHFSLLFWFSSKRNTVVKILVDALKYEYVWEVIGDFKIIAFLMGLQDDFTRFLCYLCLSDSRVIAPHYHIQDWPEQTEFSVGKNVKWEPLLDPRIVFFPSLHLKIRPYETICHSFR